ncbi:hypothetical protein [Pilimelia columellifera]|uniref:Uncharacterized protein n=1 Tax=Pilimelia columellifera subsp. columellifera TaxID=706583 RepID=A0ABN3NQ90_9ACTN
MEPTDKPEFRRQSTPRPTAGRRRATDVDSERGLRSLVGAGATQVSAAAAMRARDAARPTAEDLAAAERSVTVTHRGWTPSEELPGYRS